MDKYHKDAFERVAEEKQERILEAAVQAFAANGFSGANINTIADKAGISIGAMYKYFSSKDDLYLTVIDRAYAILADVLNRIDGEGGTIFDQLESMVRAAQTYSKRYPELNQIYLDMTSQGLSHLSRKLSGKMETISSRMYRKMLEAAKEEGDIDPDIDIPVTVFCIDNLILMLQYSYTSDYFKERMKIFIGTDAVDDDETVCAGVMRFIRGALLPPPA